MASKKKSSEDLAATIEKEGLRVSQKTDKKDKSTVAKTSSSSLSKEEFETAIKALESMTTTRDENFYRSLIEITASSSSSTVSLRASDGESETIIKVKRKGKGKIYALVAAKVLRKSIAAISSKTIEINLEEDSKELSVRNKEKTRRLGISNNKADSLPPELKLGDTIAEVSVSVEDLSAALKKAIKIAGNDITKPVLNSVAFSELHFLENDYLNILATDRHRLLEIPVKIKKNSVSDSIFSKAPFLWPLAAAKSLANELHRVARNNPETTIHIRDSVGGVEIFFGNQSWRSLGINGTYPDTKKLFEAARGENLLYLEKTQLLDALKALSAVQVGAAPVRLELVNTKEVELLYEVPGITSFDETLQNSKYLGDSHTIAFNPDFLAETCQLLEPGKYDSSGHLNETDEPTEFENKLKARLPGNANAVLFYGANYTRILLMPVSI